MDRSPPVRLPTFDTLSLYRELDRVRVSKALSWQAVPREMWEMSRELNRRRHDHSISASTITVLPQRANTSCQHALIFFRWIDRAPEDFVTGRRPRTLGRLPRAGSDRRLRWDLSELYEALNSQRMSEGLTWAQLAVKLGCSSNQLRGLRTARYATNMGLAMRITQWLRRPAAEFVYATTR